jgi:tetratricopeptide (TPR) repeat protein
VAPGLSDRNPSLDPTGRAAIESFEFETALRIVHTQIDALARKPRRNKSEAMSLHLNSRGWLHLQMGHYAEAVADCTEARRLNPNLDQHNLMLSRLFADYHESIIRPELGRLVGGLVPDACRNIAMAYYQSGFCAHAASYLELAIVSAAHAALPDLYNNLGGAYLGADLPVEALRASAKAVSLDPGIDRTNYDQALQVLAEMGQSPGPFLAGILAGPAPSSGAAGPAGSGATGPARGTGFGVSPRPAELGDLDGRIDEVRGRHDRGDRGASTMELVTLLIQRSRAHMNRHDFDRAIEDALEARRLDLHVGHGDLRLAQFLRAEFKRSLEPLFDRLHEASPAQTYNEIGAVFFAHGQHSNAATYFQLAAALGEELIRAEALNNLAGACLEMNLPILALRAAAQAVALNPEISRVNLNVASMRLKPMQLDQNALLKDRFTTFRTSH